MYMYTSNHYVVCVPDTLCTCIAGVVGRAPDLIPGVKNQPSSVTFTVDGLEVCISPIHLKFPTMDEGRHTYG